MPISHSQPREATQLNTQSNGTADQLIVQQITDLVKEVTERGFMSSVMKLQAYDVIVIASAGKGTKDSPITPLFLLPSAEIMLSLTDPETGDHYFKLATAN